MGRRKSTITVKQELEETSRPKRKATNAHIFRYLQTRNPSRLEEEDLKKALEASLEECPADFWPAEDSASCSSSDQSNAPSASSGSSSTGGGGNKKTLATNRLKPNSRLGPSKHSRKYKSSSTMQQNHLNQCNCHHNQANHQPSTNSHASSHQPCVASNHPYHSCPMSSSIPNRYKPVAKKNVYTEADFFHDGIMEYIEYELRKSWRDAHLNGRGSPP